MLDQTPGFIKRSSIKVDGPSELSDSFLVVVFGTLIQSFEDLRKQKSNRVKAANALFIAAADHLVNHAILQLKGIVESSTCLKTYLSNDVPKNSGVDFLV